MPLLLELHMTLSKLRKPSLKGAWWAFKDVLDLVFSLLLVLFISLGIYSEFDHVAPATQWLVVEVVLIIAALAVLLVMAWKYPYDE